MAAVRFSSVSKLYGPLKALQSLDLTIAAGEFVSLLGPSGSGKTTTLNLLAGLIHPNSGEIRIDDVVVNDLSPDRRDIAMVFQSYALYPHMTVAENLAFPLRARRRRRAEVDIEKSVERVAETLGLDALLSRYPKELSGGQQQRVALGRAMIRDPGVFLLDEPLSNLDVRLRMKMRRDIKELHDRVRGTTIYVTHDQSEALGLSDRVAIFNAGRLQQYAPPYDLYNRPTNMFVAGFVGERGMKFLPGELSETASGLRFSRPDLSLDLDVPPSVCANLRGRAIVLGVRAEGMDIASDVNSSQLEARVASTELSGPEQIVHLVLQDGSEAMCRADADCRFQRDEIVGLTLNPARICWFDAVTEHALPLSVRRSS